MLFSLDVLLKFVCHLSLPSPSLMIAARALRGVRAASHGTRAGYFGRQEGACEAHHCLLIRLPFSLSPLPLFFCCCISVHAYILGGAFFFFRHILISEGMMRGGKKKKSLFINLFIVYEINSFFSFSTCLSQMNV